MKTKCLVSSYWAILAKKLQYDRAVVPIFLIKELFKQSFSKNYSSSLFNTCDPHIAAYTLTFAIMKLNEQSLCLRVHEMQRLMHDAMPYNKICRRYLGLSALEE